MKNDGVRERREKGYGCKRQKVFKTSPGFLVVFTDEPWVVEWTGSVFQIQVFSQDQHSQEPTRFIGTQNIAGAFPW